MKVTSLLGERYKDSSFEIESQNLMTRGGYIKQVGGGLYSLYTPAKRIQNKIEEILRQEILQMGSYALSGEIVERQFYIAIWDKQDEGSERDMLKKASLLCEKFAAGGVVTDILTKKEIVRLVNLVNNPSYTHLEDAETSASIPTLKGVM
jgi:hypothetical protein